MRLIQSSVYANNIEINFSGWCRNQSLRTIQRYIDLWDRYRDGLISEVNTEVNICDWYRNQLLRSIDLYIDLRSIQQRDIHLCDEYRGWSLRSIHRSIYVINTQINLWNQHKDQSTTQLTQRLIVEIYTDITLRYPFRDWSRWYFQRPIP